MENDIANEEDYDEDNEMYFEKRIKERVERDRRAAEEEAERERIRQEEDEHEENESKCFKSYYVAF
jgi:tetrahydromethanopterin S-methyltransferase subunit A